MAPREPMRFVIGIDDFDVVHLPAHAREVGSDAFRSAVRTYYEREFAPIGGSVDVEVEPDVIRVTWEPVGPDQGLFEQAVALLERGDLPKAIPPLQALVAVEPNNADAHYNLGMALSDLGELEQAKLHLLKVTHLDPDNVNALVALGVALHRSGDQQGARRRLTQAVTADPGNPYAHRNLAAVLGNLQEYDEAIAHFREAYALLPTDQLAVFGLARALYDFGDADDLAEADELFTTTIALNPRSDVAEMARDARSRIAQQEMRTSGVPRMDATMYILGALEKFAGMTDEQVRAVAYEIAMLGRQGLEVNNPDVTYPLRTLPGTYTGMHLMSLMYTAFKQVAPDTDIGFDLAQEYAAARQLFDTKGTRR